MPAEVIIFQPIFSPPILRKLRDNWLILLVILGGIILRLGYSANQLSVLFNDNAKNAWEAAHFLDNFDWLTLLKIPPHFEIFIWSVLFKIFGPTAFAYNLLGIIQFVFLAIFYYLCLQKISGKKVALIATFLLAFSPPIFALDNLFFSGHSRGVMFTWLIIYLFFLIWEQSSLKRYLLLGFWGGVAVATSKLTPLIAIVSGFITFFLKDREFYKSKKFLPFLLVLMVSFLLFFNLEQLQAKSLYREGISHFNPHFLLKSFYVAKSSLFVWGANVTYYMRIGLQNKLPKIIYGLHFLIIIPLWFLLHRKDFQKVMVFPLFLLIFTTAFAVISAAWAISRYYLQFIPIYIYFLSEVLIKAIEAGRKKYKIPAGVLLFLFCCFSVFNNLHFYPSPYQDIFKVIKFAKDNDIKAIYTDYHMQFALVFHSQETIAAASGVDQVVYAGSIFDKIVENAPSVSYLYDSVSERLEQYLAQAKISYQRRNFGRLALYYNLSPRLAPNQLQ